MVLSLIIGITAQPMKSFASVKENVYYVGLGDSLAAGQTPFGKIGKGYPDFIAGKFAEAGVLNSFVKDYAVSGYTTKNVLDDLVNDVNKGKSGDIQTVVRHATHITLDAGANDLLKLLIIDKDKGTISFDQQQLPLAFTQIQKNLTETIVDLKKINPNVKIYLMGYYNPLPYLQADNQALLNASLSYLNSLIQTISTQTGATFVPVDKTIASNIGFLPNPQDVHLSEDGYKAISEQFWKVMKPEVEDKPQPGDGKKTPIVYWDGMILKKGQVGKLVIQKPINLWKNENGKLKFIRVLHAGEVFRVYSFNKLFGGQFGIGGGLYVSKIEKYVLYKTPSKQKIDQVNK